MIHHRLFLVRESSVQGGFVISFFFNNRVYHTPVMPHVHPTSQAVTYSLDEGKTKFYDLLQLVEFYQLNKGTLCSKLTHFVINKISVRSESPTDSSNSCKNASDVSLDSKEAMVCMVATDDNHNSKGSGRSNGAVATASSSTGSSDDERSVATAVDANMASEEETEHEEADESMKEEH